MDEWISRRREEALDNSIRRAILDLLGERGMSIRELRVELAGDLSLNQVNYHLARLQDAELVRAADGRYWRMVAR